MLPQVRQKMSLSCSQWWDTSTIRLTLFCCPGEVQGQLSQVLLWGAGTALPLCYLRVNSPTCLKCWWVGVGKGHLFSGKVAIWKMRAGAKSFTITFTGLVHLCSHLQGDLCCVSRQNTEQTFLSVVAGQGVISLTISAHSFSLLSLQIYICPQDLNLSVSLSLSLP